MTAANDKQPLKLHEDLCMHIFSASATLIGVCLTVIGIIHILVRSKNVDTFADDILVVDALVFLTSCLTSYWALRSRSTARLYKIERIADFTFLTGLVLMAFACAFITYALVD